MENNAKRRPPMNSALAWGILTSIAFAGIVSFSGPFLQNVFVSHKSVRVLSMEEDVPSKNGDGADPEDFTVTVEPVALLEDSITISEKLLLSAEINNKKEVPQDMSYAFLVTDDEGNLLRSPAYPEPVTLDPLSSTFLELEIDSSGIANGFYEAKLSIAVGTNEVYSGLIYPIHFQISKGTITYLNSEEYYMLSKAGTAI